MLILEKKRCVNARKTERNENGNKKNTYTNISYKERGTWKEREICTFSNKRKCKIETKNWQQRPFWASSRKSRIFFDWIVSFYFVYAHDFLLLLSELNKKLPFIPLQARHIFILSFYFVLSFYYLILLFVWLICRFLYYSTSMQYDCSNYGTVIVM